MLFLLIIIIVALSEFHAKRDDFLLLIYPNHMSVCIVSVMFWHVQ